MVTYYEIMGTDLSKLTTAADDWAAMAEDFDKLARTYAQQVRGISLGGTWVGLSAGGTTGTPASRPTSPEAW
ncbi:hypothetical protein ACIRPQ_01730 [Streptomyces sp. NPDC101213]|uniref:hypothetical protein n=1 Tax=Streptomyces sp. NPDC101213 TaxID=3366130 RepID=UPI003829CCDB